MTIAFDPRSKILVIFLVVLCTAFLPSLEWEGALIALILVFGCLSRRIRSSLGWTAVYAAAYIFWNWYISQDSGLGHTMLIAWTGLMFKLFPCLMISSIVLKTTKINEFLTAMNRSHVPRQIVIPLAILLRYLPMVREDWSYIRDAMILKGISPTLWGFITRPALTMECLYVPLLITASKTADDLSIASMTRGIEHPGARTSITELKMRWYDFTAVTVFAIFTILSIVDVSSFL